MTVTSGLPIVVGRRPFCVWDPDLAAKNRDFLAGVDPTYYGYVANVLTPHLTGDSPQHAAVAIRLAYAQALETFFALLGAAIQAPRCAVGWVLLYEKDDLPWLVRSLADGTPVKTLLRDGVTTWPALSEAVHFGMENDGDGDAIPRAKAAFAGLWRHFAADFLDEYARREYNSLKHGLRVRAGGLHIRVAPSDEASAPPPTEAFETLAKSDFGSGFYSKHFVENDQKPKANVYLRHCYRSWAPEHLAAGLHLLEVSMHNVLITLRREAGEPLERLQFRVPTDLSVIDHFTQTRSGFHLVWRDGGPPSSEDLCKPEQVLAWYATAAAASDRTASGPTG